METNREKDLSAEEVRALSVRATNQLIADAEAGRLFDNKELAEVIAGCLRTSAQPQLRTLKFLLDQRELEGIPPWDKDERAKKRSKLE